MKKEDQESDVVNERTPIVGLLKSTATFARVVLGRYMMYYDSQQGGWVIIDIMTRKDVLSGATELQAVRKMIELQRRKTI